MVITPKGLNKQLSNKTMPSKEEIIDSIDQYDAREIVGFIKAGVVTFDELCKEAGQYFPATLRRDVKSLLAQEIKEGKEEEDWKKAKSSRSVEALDTYLTNYPKGKHRGEARDLIQKLENDTAPVDNDEADDADDEDTYNKTSLKDDIEWLWKDGADENEIFECIQSKCENKAKAEVLALMREDPNVIPAGALRILCNEKIIKGRDLERIGINREFIKSMKNQEQRASFDIPEKLVKINKRSTEVYFWGIPDSGKSCALGAILSTAYNGSVAHSMSRDNNCQGYGYLVRLSSLFKEGGKVVTLPEKTAIRATYEMGFDLEDNERLRHPITCIDLAGELMRCMYEYNSKEEMKDEDKEVLETVTNILIDNRTGNTKIHFFVLEYGAEKRKYKGLAQEDLLDAAMTYIKDKGIFKKDTDAIFLMVTKADKVKTKDSAKRKEILHEYIRKNYQGFYNSLETLCRDNEINDGEVEIYPFSLGEVCMRYYCLFNDSAAKRIVQLLIDRTKGFRGGRRGRLLKGLRG